MAPDHDDLACEFYDTLRAYRAAATADLRVYYIRRLMTFAEDTNQHVLELTARDLSRWLSKEVGQSPWTKRTAKSSVSVFFSWAHALRMIEHNPADGLPSMRAPRGVPNPCPEPAIREALKRCTRRVDVLMIFLGEYQGLRAGEIAQLHTSDIVDDQIRVRGKGRRDRVVPLHPLLRDVLRVFPSGYLFPSDKNPHGHMLPASIGRRVRYLLGNQPRRNSHSLRHRFGVDALELNPDLMALRDLLGHESVATTEIYTRASTKRLRVMVEALPERPGDRAAFEGLIAVPN
ncbi:MAG TPA: tyrosine-type recombinase/integrase [Brevibacterium senegalense]|uniref:Tyrosine-type recombinase/integrase n=1 Tax=Brevibacterium senegalense TaxID=1033736 RepID=A0A921SPC8_9MICO|nr:tyrosine-type recombinase/integrase [Brevibacterium senegalense]